MSKTYLVAWQIIQLMHQHITNVYYEFNVFFLIVAEAFGIDLLSHVYIVYMHYCFVTNGS